MRITNIQTSDFRNSQNNASHASKSGAHNKSKPATDIAPNQQLVPTQTVIYKQFTNARPHSSNPFLAQYINQVSGRRTRGFIGRKPGWQVKQSYQLTAEILEFEPVSKLDKSI